MGIVWSEVYYLLCRSECPKKREGHDEIFSTPWLFSLVGINSFVAISSWWFGPEFLLGLALIFHWKHLKLLDMKAAAGERLWLWLQGAGVARARSSGCRRWGWCLDIKHMSQQQPCASSSRVRSWKKTGPNRKSISMYAMPADISDPSQVCNSCCVGISLCARLFGVNYMFDAVHLFVHRLICLDIVYFRRVLEFMFRYSKWNAIQVNCFCLIWMHQK
jgi:hypothetical protein